MAGIRPPKANRAVEPWRYTRGHVESALAIGLSNDEISLQQCPYESRAFHTSRPCALVALAALVRQIAGSRLPREHRSSLTVTLRALATWVFGLDTTQKDYLAHLEKHLAQKLGVAL